MRIVRHERGELMLQDERIFRGRLIASSTLGSDVADRLGVDAMADLSIHLSAATSTGMSKALAKSRAYLMQFRENERKSK